MERLKMESIDITQKNIDRIGALFPNVITEMRDENGNLKKGINFELLKQELSGDVIEGDECYDFTWVGKKAAIVEGNTPIRKTLRPCIEESKDWESTGNLYIEGDNLDVLKILQESYLNSIKMIYIDPPYNTGKDFIYKDNFIIDKEEYDEEIGLYDEEENRLFKNNETNGRFHSDWCSMIFPRLKLANNLLREDGIIFISIDDNEVRNLRYICDEIYGESNFITQLIWQNKKGGGNDSTHIAVEHEYILVYAKNKVSLGEFYESYSEEYAKRYKEKDEVGLFFWDTFKRKSGKQYYPIECPDGTILEFDEDDNPISWLRSEARFEEDKKIGDIRFIETNNGWSVQFKQRMPLGKKPRSIFVTETIIDGKGTTSTGANNVYEYFKKDVFSNPKPVELLDFLLGFGMKNNDIVLDFFSGSATIAEAVLKANLDNGHRKYIAVQLQEDIDQMLSSSSANAKRVAENAISVLDELRRPHYITELAKERIRRAGEKINEEINENNTRLKLGEEAKPLVDIGFRVLKVDSTNMKDVYYAANEYNQSMLARLESNIKEDRTDLDLLYGVLLDWGLPLSLSHKIEEIDGISVHTVDEGSLVACFAERVSESVVREIAKRQPLRVVFRDSSFANSPDKINVGEIFKLLAPNTTIKVI